MTRLPPLNLQKWRKVSSLDEVLKKTFSITAQNWDYVVPSGLLPFSFNPEAWRFFCVCLRFKLTGFVWLCVTLDQWNLVGYIAKLTRFLAPFEHVLFTCSETFQVFRAQEHVLFMCFGTLWSAKRPTLKFVVFQTALTPRWFGKGR